MRETILIVDDEESIRRTFGEWLQTTPARVLMAADSEAALIHADAETIDLAILDWNLGSGSDGLQLLKELVIYQPDITAILVTGFAGQATPLEALRMGVRDYLDKDHDLNRATFLKAVEQQLAVIRPAKRQRELNASLKGFREAVDNVLPLVRSAATLNDPVPLPVAVHSLFRFLQRATGATDGVLIVRQITPDGSDATVCYDTNGNPLPGPNVPFSRSLAASVVSMQDPCIMNGFSPESAGLVDLMPFEKNRTSILASPIRVGPGTHVVVELFDKPTFTDDDRRLVAIASDLGAELLRQALAERQTHRLLFDAVEAALQASDQVTRTLNTSTEPNAASVAAIERLKLGLANDPNAVIDAETGLKLVEAVRSLAGRHGTPAVEHCVKLVRNLQELLDGLTGTDA
jgi:two-component system, NtrC family, nitrogen regulation response regulator NtrX